MRSIISWKGWALAACALQLGAAGCGGRDPILDRADQLAAGDPAASTASGAPAVGQAPAPAPVRPEDPGVGVPGEPGPIDPGAPAPIDPGEPTPGVPDEPPPGVADQPPPDGQVGAIDLGPTVTVSGVVSMDDYRGSPVRIDVFDGDQLAAAGGKSKRPRVIATLQVAGPGPFSLEVPSAPGKVWLGAYADEDKDQRPGPLDPAAWAAENPIYVDKPRSGLKIKLERRPPPPTLE